MNARPYGRGVMLMFRSADISESGFKPLVSLDLSFPYRILSDRETSTAQQLCKSSDLEKYRTLNCFAPEKEKSDSRNFHTVKQTTLPPEPSTLRSYATLLSALLGGVVAVNTYKIVNN
jgi:hypothetical protein